MSHVPAWWYGPYLAAALLLMGAGTAKAWRPVPTAGVLRQAGMPVAIALVRAGAAAEVAVGVWAFTGSRWAALAVCLSYLAFSLFVLAAQRAGSPVSACGCFGRADVAPTAGHLALNLAGCGLAALAAARPHPGIEGTLRSQPLVAVALLVTALGTAYLCYLVMTALPRLRLSTGGSA